MHGLAVFEKEKLPLTCNLLLKETDSFTGTFSLAIVYLDLSSLSAALPTGTLHVVHRSLCNLVRLVNPGYFIGLFSVFNIHCKHSS